MEIDAPYGMTRRLPATTLADVRARVAAALQAEGFGVLTEIDVQKTLETKLGERIDPYLILGACNPKLAHRAIRSDPSIGLLLPCNVILVQDGADVIVSAASPEAMFAIARSASGELASVAREAEERLGRALATI